MQISTFCTYRMHTSLIYSEQVASMINKKVYGNNTDLR